MFDFDKIKSGNLISDKEMYQNMRDDGISEANLERWIGEGYTINQLYALWVNLENMPD